MVNVAGMSCEQRSESTDCPPIDHYSRIASPLSPRLPTELLSLVMDFVEDSNTMRHCSLVGSRLLPHARRVLFAQVRIIIGPEGSRNLDRLLECYTTRPYAQYARHLTIEFRGERSYASHYLDDYPDTQAIITLLSTCQQAIHPANTSLPPSASNISSLNISGIAGSFLDFARILHAFPRVTQVRCDPHGSWRGHNEELDDFLTTAPLPPRVQHLQIFRMNPRGLYQVIFPQTADVRLRSLSIHGCIITALEWNALIHRCGTRLEELIVDEPMLYFGYVVLDLSANTQLKFVRLVHDALPDVGASFLGWFLPTLSTLNSTRLEQVSLGFCVIHNSDQVSVRSALLALDQALCEGPSRNTLQRVEIISWIVSPSGPPRRPSADYTKTFLQEVFPTCCARKLLWSNVSSPSLPIQI